MPHPKFQLYKHIKISGKWRYCRAAIYLQRPDGHDLTIRGKRRETRTVEIGPRLAGEINEHRKRSNSEYLFPTRKGKPNQHLLRDLS